MMEKIALTGKTSKAFTSEQNSMEMGRTEIVSK
jgi:hypothetical protein